MCLDPNRAYLKPGRSQGKSSKNGHSFCICFLDASGCSVQMWIPEFGQEDQGLTTVLLEAAKKILRLWSPTLLPEDVPHSFDMQMRMRISTANRTRNAHKVRMPMVHFGQLTCWLKSHVWLCGKYVSDISTDRLVWK